MQKLKNTPLFNGAIAISIFFANIGFTGQSTGMANSDTVFLGNYTAIRISIFDSATSRSNQQIGIYREMHEVQKIQSNRVGLVDFCYSYKTDLNNCFMNDLNRDGLSEIALLLLPDDGNGEGNTFALYTLKNDTIVLVNEFNIGISAPYFDDLDKDSIPELIFSDSYYYYLNLAGPLLIWKWKNGRYEQSNFNFSEYLLAGAERGWESQEPVIGGGNDTFQYSPENWNQIPQLKALGSLMLLYIYSGRPEIADSLLISHWPEAIPGKMQFKSKIWEIVNDDPFWGRVSQSKW